MKLIPQVDLYLREEPQVNHKVELLLRARKELGIHAAGAEILFMSFADYQYLIKNFDRCEEKVMKIKKTLEDAGLKTYFSIHMPWESTAQFGMDGEGFPNLQKFEHVFNFAKDVVECINCHVHNGFATDKFWAWKNGLPFDYEEKIRQLKIIQKNLLLMQKKVYHPERIAIENLFSSPEQKNIQCLGILPYEFSQYLLTTGVGLTLDTSHMGIMIDMCRKVAGGYTVQGIFSEETTFCHTIADSAVDAYFPLAKHTTHLHIGVNDGLLEGQIPGKNGAIDVESYKEFLKRYLEEMDKHIKKPVGAVLELPEADYTNCVNAWEMMVLMKEFWE